MSQPVTKVSLTGIKPTGEPHLGNLIGAIRPALKLAEKYDSIYFIADYHALTTERDPEKFRHYTRSVAATWLTAGLDRTRRSSTDSRTSPRSSSWPGHWPA